MPDRPFFSDESILMRWMNLEISKINRGVVAERKLLNDLVDMERPEIPTKGGGTYHFKKDTLVMLRTRLPQSLSGRLRLPVLCYFDSSVGDSCFITDDQGVDMLKELKEIRLHEGND